MQTAIDTCISWIVNNFPASGGFLQAITINANGRYQWRTLTSAQTANLRTQLASLITTID